MSQNQISPKNKKPGAARYVGRIILFLIPGLVYALTFGGDVAVPPGGAAYSDLLITHYPNLLYLRESIAINQQLPLWSNLIQSGAPFAANPLSGVFYLPGWLAMLFPLPAGLSLVVAAHVIFGTWGMYKYLGQQQVEELGRVIGALSFGLMPKFAAHFGAGHITLLYAISWTPWLLFISGEDTAGWKTGAIAGMLFLADPRWSIYAGMIWLTHDIAYRHNSWVKKLIFYMKTALMAALVSAPLLIPLLEYLQIATRTKLSARDMLTGSLPLQNLIGVLIPGSGGNTEWYFYAGGTLLALFVLQLFLNGIRKSNRFWNAWVILSVLMAFGTGSLGSGWLNKIPIFNLLRVPARSLFLTGICLAVIGAKTVGQLSKEVRDHSRLRKIYFGMIASGMMMLIGLVFLTRAQPIMVLWGFAFFMLSGLLLHLHQDSSINKSLVLGLFAGILILDLLGAGLAAYQIEGKENREPSERLAAVIAEEGYFRIYSPSYSVDQYAAAEYHLELADGVDPLQISSYVDFMEEATGVPQDQYSVTIPPFATGNPAQDNKNAVLDSKRLGLLNVKYIVSEFEISAPGISPRSTAGIPKIYFNQEVLPRAWIEREDLGQYTLDHANPGQAEILSKTANEIIIQAVGPGKLVISEIQYPGWKVYLDGERQELLVSHEVLRSVLLPEGEHLVSFRFSPITVTIGCILAGIAWIILAFKLIGIRIEKISD